MTDLAPAVGNALAELGEAFRRARSPMPKPPSKLKAPARTAARRENRLNEFPKSMFRPTDMFCMQFHAMREVKLGYNPPQRVWGKLTCAERATLPLRSRISMVMLGLGFDQSILSMPKFSLK